MGAHGARVGGRRAARVLLQRPDRAHMERGHQRVQGWRGYLQFICILMLKFYFFIFLLAFYLILRCRF